MTLVLMLCGLAIENLLKGILVAQGTNATATGRLDRTLQTHDLARLFERAGVPCTAADRLFLNQLRRFVESGKYPIGTAPPRGHRKEKSWLRVPQDIDHVFRLLELLDSTLRRLAPEHTLGAIQLDTLCARR